MEVVETLADEGVAEEVVGVPGKPKLPPTTRKSAVHPFDSSVCMVTSDNLDLKPSALLSAACFACDESKRTDPTSRLTLVSSSDVVLCAAFSCVSVVVMLLHDSDQNKPGKIVRTTQR